MLEVKSPPSLQGWTAYVINQGYEYDGRVVSDEYNDSIHSSLISIDWNGGEPPEIVMVNHHEVISLDDEQGYLVIRSAGREIGFLPTPIVHTCTSECPSYEGTGISQSS